jgi:hypothetical protein
MFHRRHTRSALSPAAVAKVSTVRLLRSDEELFAAMDRATAFARRDDPTEQRPSSPTE